MVFVNFHMNRKKKKFLMSPLNSNSINFPLYNRSKQCYNHGSQMFSFLFIFFFNLCTVYLKKCSFFLSLFFFFFICCVQQYSSVFSFFFLFFFHLHCPVAFFFSFRFFSVFIFFSFFFFSFHNKLLIQCPFFFSTLYLPLSVLTLIL